MNAQNYQIIVGVDGSEGGRRALNWAIHEASTRGGSVEAITAWRWDDVADAYDGADAAQAAAEAMLTKEIESVPTFQRERITIAARAAEGRPAEVLVAATKTADVLVLGSHGHGRLRHTVLGSVSEECVRMATCPVVVVPAHDRAGGVSAEPVPRTGD